MNTNCWEFLGITPTINQALIKKAYARLLRRHHPEDDPENFQRLREAYEAALAASRRLKQEEQEQVVPVDDVSPMETAQPAEPLTPAGETPPAAQPEASSSAPAQAQAGTNDQQEWTQLTDAILALYDDFERRIQPQAWQQLLNSPPLQRLDIKRNMAIWLFGFLGHHRCIPQAVKSLLINTFDWEYSLSTLEEAYGEENTQALMDFLEYGHWQITFEKLRFHGEWTREQSDHYLMLREHLAIANLQGDQAALEQSLVALSDANVSDPELTFWLISFYIARKQFRQALEQVQHLQELAPLSLDTHLQSGRVHMLLDDPTAAAEAFRQALQIDENNVLATKGLANCYLKAGYSYEARELYLQVMELAPYDMEARVQVMQINQATIEKGFTDLKSEKYSMKYCCEVAECYFQIGDYQTCIDFVDAIASRASTNAKPLYRMIRGSIFESIYRALFTKHGDFKHQQVPPRLFEYQGDAYRALERSGPAVEAYRKAIALSEAQGEHTFDARLKLAHIVVAERYFHDARAMGQTLCEINPNNAEAWYILGYSTFHMGLANDAALEDALDPLGRAISLDPQNWLYYSSRSLVYFNLERYAEALPDLEATLKAEHGFSWAWYRKGVCLRELGYLAEAMEAFNQAIDFVSAAKQSAEALARLALQQGRLEQARHALEQYRHHEGDPGVIQELSQALAEQQCAGNDQPA